MRVKHLKLYEDLGLHHAPKVFLQQARTLNLSLLSSSQPSSYDPATYFEACICTEVYGLKIICTQIIAKHP